jgi:hypothetical protein
MCKYENDPVLEAVLSARPEDADLRYDLIYITRAERSALREAALQLSPVAPAPDTSTARLAWLADRLANMSSRLPAEQYEAAGRRP